MTLSDFLAVIDIVVTVLIGFVITHIVAVRDSRTRAIKDYYIQELAGIKAEISRFYADLLKGELEAKDIISWYTTIRNRIDCFDKSVRKTFAIYEECIAKKVFANYKLITDSTDFNTHYNQGKINFSVATKRGIGINEKQLYMLIERTLYDINNVRTRDYLERKCLEFKSHYMYYRNSESIGRKDTFIAIAKDWLNSHKSGILSWILLILVIVGVLVYYGRVVKEDEKEYDKGEILQRLDSLNTTLKVISDKNIEPVVVIESPSTYSIRVNEVSSTDTIRLRGSIKAVK